MSTARSAGRQGVQAHALAEELARQSHVYRQMAFNFEAAAASEERLEHTLSPLRDQGYHVLADRRWPGSTRAQVDFVVVGPGGVFIVDAKTWRDVRVERSGGMERVFQGDDDVTERFAALADLGMTTEAAMAEIGLAPTEVHTFAVFTNRRDITARVMGVELLSEAGVVKRILQRGVRLSLVEVEHVLAHTMATFPPYASVATPLSVVVRAPVSPAPAQPELLTVEEITGAAYEGLAAEPIESWMAFLHPDQARVVRRTFNGPSRIRGAAGTGKTVVGLHRAAHIARTRPGTVLVTTYVSTLPGVLRTLFERMAPEVADRVEFTSVFALAKRVLEERGIRWRLNGTAADRLWRQVWSRYGANGPVGRILADPRYWHDEIASVIKGRGLSSFEEYANCARTGRKRNLQPSERAAVWELAGHYQSALDEFGVWDFADAVLNAEAALQVDPCTDYSAVVIDEAQDLSCAMVRMLHALVGDGPDAFNLIGDGQQSIYPGGYTLAELGISIAGRGVVMTRNYRNTKEIAEFATGLLRDTGYVDIESGARSMTDAAEFLRRGARPKVVRFNSGQRHDEALIERVRSLLADPTVHPGDVGVLAMYRRDVAHALDLLRAAGLPAIDLEDYDGRPVRAVKVGTVKRAKGLEFKHVLVVRAPRRLLERIDAAPSESQQERTELELRELYVAMTRARDGLWVGVA